MAIKKRKGYYYGDDQEDLKKEIVRFSRLNGYEATHFRNPICGCGGDRFRLVLNDEEGVAARFCMACDESQGIGDSDDHADDVESVWEPECVCGGIDFKITAGVALYEDSEDVRWFYLGLFCNTCKLIGVFGHWKNEYQGYQELLDRV